MWPSTRSASPGPSSGLWPAWARPGSPPAPPTWPTTRRRTRIDPLHPKLQIPSRTEAAMGSCLCFSVPPLFPRKSRRLRPVSVINIIPPRCPEKGAQTGCFCNLILSKRKITDENSAFSRKKRGKFLRKIGNKGLQFWNKRIILPLMVLSGDRRYKMRRRKGWMAALWQS